MVVCSEELNRNDIYEEVKTYLITHQERRISYRKKSYIKDILCELISKDLRFDIIKLIIDKQIFNNEDIFNCAITYNNNRIAKFLLHYDASLLCYNYLIYYFYRKKTLNPQKIHFILNIKKDKPYKISEILCRLIELNDLKTFKNLLNYNDMNINFVIEILSFCKNKVALSNEELEKIIYHPSYNNFLDINEKTKYRKYPLLNAVKKNNIKFVKLIVDYAKKFNIILELNNADESYSPIFQSILQDNFDIIKLLIDYAEENNIILNLNVKNYNGDYPLLIAVKNKNKNKNKDKNKDKNKKEIVKLLIDYAQKFNIILELNKKNNNQESPILLALKSNNKELVQLFLEYAKTNNIDLTIGNPNDNVTNNNKVYNAIKNYEFIHVLMDYSKNNHIVLDIHNNYDLESLLSYSIKYNRFNDARLLVNRGISFINNIEGIFRYLSRNNSITLKKVIFLLNMTKENMSINSEILCELIKQKQLKILKELLNYNDMNIKFVKKILSIYENKTVFSDHKLKKLIYHYDYNNNYINLNEKTNHGDYPLLCAVKKNNIDMVKLFIDYAKASQTALILNDRNMENEGPLLCAIQNNNIKMVQLLMTYAKENNIILKINHHDKLENEILFHVLKNINFELFQFLIQYSKENDFLLDIEGNVLFNIHNFFLMDEWGNGARLSSFLMKYIDENCIFVDLNKKDKNGDYPLLSLIRCNIISLIKYLLSFAKKKEIILDLNQKNNNGEYPLSLAVRNNKIELVQLLINYAKENNIILKMDNYGDSNYGNLFHVLINSNFDLFQLLIQYSEENNFLLDIEGNELFNKYSFFLMDKWGNGARFSNFLMKYIDENCIFVDLNKKDKNGDYPLLSLVRCYNISFVKFLITFAKKKEIILDINQKNNDGEYPLSLAVYNNNIELVQLLINYAKENNIILKMDNYGYTSNGILFNLIKNCNIELFKLLIHYADENDFLLDIKGNELFNDQHYYFFRYMYNDNLRFNCLLMNYIDENDIIVDLNQKNKNGDYPLLSLVRCNDISIVKYLIDYAKRKDIVLDINQKNNNGEYPLSLAVGRNNIELVQLLINYAKENCIILKMDNHGDTNNGILFNLIQRCNIELFQLLIQYADENNFLLDIKGNELFNDQHYYFFRYMYNDNLRFNSLLMNYIDENDIIVDLNQKNENGDYPLLLLVRCNDISIVRYLIDFAKRKNIVLDLNQKNNYGQNALSLAIHNNNTELVQLLKNYANENNIILNINVESKF